MTILAYAEAGAYAGALGSLAIGADPGRGAGFGALSGAVFSGIGGLGGKGWKWDLARIPLAGIAGGGIAELAGGSFWDGFILASSIAGADFLYRAILDTRPETKGLGATMKPATGSGQPKLDADGKPILGKDGKEIVLHVDPNTNTVGERSRTGYSKFWQKFNNQVKGETGIVMNTVGTKLPGFQGLGRAHDILGGFITANYGETVWGLVNIPSMAPIYGLNLAGSAINDAPGLIGLYESIDERR